MNKSAKKDRDSFQGGHCKGEIVILKASSTGFSSKTNISTLVEKFKFLKISKEKIEVQFLIRYMI